MIELATPRIIGGDFIKWLDWLVASFIVMQEVGEYIETEEAHLARLKRMDEVMNELAKARQ